MPQNKGSGGKHRRKSKGETTQSVDIAYKSPGQEYAQITKSIGNGFMEVSCFLESGNITKRAHIRGKLRKRVRMVPGDIVLISLREYQDETCDIVCKYSSHEARLLHARKQLPENIDISNTDTAVVNNDQISFQEEVDDEPIFNSHKSQQNRNLDLPPSDSDEDDNIVPQQNRNLDLPPSDSDEDNDINIDDL